MNGAVVTFFFNQIALNGGEVEIPLESRVAVESARLSFTRKRKGLAKDHPAIASRLEFYSKHINGQWSLVVKRIDNPEIMPGAVFKDKEGNTITPEFFAERSIIDISDEKVSMIRKGPERIYDLWVAERTESETSLSDLFDFVAKGLNLEELDDENQEIYAQLYENEQACSVDLHSGIAENNR